MPSHLFTIALRNVFRNKVFAAINIGGLAMGLVAFLFLLQYISLERSVNQFHDNLPRMFRLLNEDKAGVTWPEMEPGWAAIAKQRFPEIDDYCRFTRGVANGIVANGDEPAISFREESAGYAEDNFFTFFSFPLVAGNAASFRHPNVVFISESAAQKYFGSLEVVGKSLVLNNQFGATKYSVQGVFKNQKDNSDIRYDLLFSLVTLANPANLNDNSWAATDNLSSQFINTFFLLGTRVNTQLLETKLNSLRDELNEDKDGVRFRLQALADMHLGSSVNETLTTTGNVKYVYMLGAIALLILLIAWFNYINLSTATSFKRANEVGVRKVLGASRWRLVLQFMSESFLINAFALVVALISVLLLQPLFNRLVDRSLSLADIGDLQTWVYGLLLLITGSVLSGAYTAFSLSGYNPVATLKGKINRSNKGAVLRKSLVVSQFVISIALIIATILIYTQLNYMQSKNLGINTNQLLVVRGPEVGNDSTYKNRRAAFWNALEQQSFVKAFCATGAIPGNGYNFKTNGFTQPASKKDDQFKTYSFAIISDRYMDTYEIGLRAGRNFTAAECLVDWNDNSKVLMNEAAIRELGFANPEDALRTPIQWDERALQVVGVLEDYHHNSLQQRIEPMIFYPQNNNGFFSIRLTADKMPEKIAALEKLYKQSFSGNPFEYYFIDDIYNHKYLSEQRYGKLFTTASVWAIFIACLGLFGLATFTVESRVKEIGVRKVLGANVPQIVRLLSRDFILLVLIAFLIASPIAWYGMSRWLEDFAYRISIEWWVFALAGAIALLIALATVSYQSVKAAIANPVKSLRTE